MQVEKRGGNTKVRGRGAPQQSRHSLQPMANPIPEQNTPDRNAAPRPHSGAEERGKEEGKAEKNCDGLIASPTAPFSHITQISLISQSLKHAKNDPMTLGYSRAEESKEKFWDCKG
ncbi:hypothetical protein TURU_114618 [Turdus rufiventris]|nr:hypothetical protein TURU_114618 [Turdus rufiventris]